MAKKNHRPAVVEDQAGDAIEPGVMKATVYLDLENVLQQGLPIDRPLRLRIDAWHPGTPLYAATVTVEED